MMPLRPHLQMFTVRFSRMLKLQQAVEHTALWKSVFVSLTNPPKLFSWTPRWITHTWLQGGTPKVFFRFLKRRWDSLPTTRRLSAHDERPGWVWTEWRPVCNVKVEDRAALCCALKPEPANLTGAAVDSHHRSSTWMQQMRQRSAPFSPGVQDGASLCLSPSSKLFAVNRT